MNRPALPAPLARARDALAQLHPGSDNPFAFDFATAIAAACNEAAMVLESRHSPGTAEGMRAVVAECRRIANQAEARADTLSVIAKQDAP